MTLKTQQRFKSETGLAYLKTGVGSPIVLIHGVGLRAEAWLNQVPVLSEHHTVYAIDMPGHGESDLLADADAGLDEYVDLIATWIQAEIKEPVIMMGHSMGSMIALNFAARYSGICSGVAALNSVYRRSPQAKQAVQQRALDMIENPVLSNVTTPISRWFDDNAKGFEKQMASLCEQWLLAAPAKGYARAYQIFSQNDGPKDEALASLEMPAIFITGDGDANSSGDMSKRMAAICPNGHYAVIEHSRHMVQMTHPDEVNQLLVKFVKQCSIKIK
ncbi:alpha/beta fold hydrolase [Amphritea sp.]|uniref:alpha/beta fold hydrolase n=1 Tax=Amphritea sp. TaxID=1872502 RepID=UPI003A957F05